MPRAQAHPLWLVPALAFALGAPAVGRAETDETFEKLWSATFIAEGSVVSSDWRSNDRTDFFDQWQWVPNQEQVFPIEIGIREATFDALENGETPRWQLRYSSPTSNLGISGGEIDQPFLNQRAEVAGRLDGLALDLEYRRFRTGDLRIFPTTLGRPYSDLTSPDDIFIRDRTGLAAELRVRPAELQAGDEGLVEGLSTLEISLRGGYQSRPGRRQTRFMLSPTNQWTGLTQILDQDASRVGGGLLVVPGGALTVDVDVDYDRFRGTPTLLQGMLAPSVPPPDATIGFVPDSDRIAGRARLRGSFGAGTVVEGGFQVARLKQVEPLTPRQQAAGLVDNSVISWSANLAVDVPLSDRFAANAYAKVDTRRNDVDRDSVLFSATNGSQVDEFLRALDRIEAGLEVVHDFLPGQQVAVGARFESVERTLDFADPRVGNPVILPVNALIAADTRMWSVYGRTRIRLRHRLRIQAELGYRGAPETGYVTDLDRYVYGKLRFSTALQLWRPVQLTGFAQGGHGENRQFEMVDGTGPVPSGPVLSRDFERSDWRAGITASVSPRIDWNVFASLSYARATQSNPLVLSTLQRYFQTSQSIIFGNDGVPDWSNGQTNFTLGVHTRLREATDVSASYVFTRPDAEYAAVLASPAVDAISASSVVRSNIHGLQLELGHQLREGLRVLVGYRLQLLDDASPTPSGRGSVVVPIPLSVTHQQLTFGLTLSEALWRRSP